MPDNPVIEHLLKGIKYAESRGKLIPSMAVGDNDTAYGAYQMHDIALKDIQRLRPDGIAKGIKSMKDILGNEPLQKALAREYLDLLITHYKLQEPDAVMAYNLGPGRVKAGKINREYLATVLKGMQR